MLRFRRAQKSSEDIPRPPSRLSKGFEGLAARKPTNGNRLSRHFNTLNAEAVSPTKFRSPAAPQTHANGDAYHRDRSAIADDEIMKLVHRVFILPGAAKAPGVVAFCGVDQGAGCTWVCARASEVLASQTSGTVCVVDANLRSPSLDGHFRIEKSAGFTNAMKDSQPMSAFARRVRPDNLWVLTAGAKVSEPDMTLNGALNPERLEEKFSRVAQPF